MLSREQDNKCHWHWFRPWRRANIDQRGISLWVGGKRVARATQIYMWAEFEECNPAGTLRALREVGSKAKRRGRQPELDGGLSGSDVECTLCTGYVALWSSFCGLFVLTPFG